MQLKDYLKESFDKQYAFRVKMACDCGSSEMDMLEHVLQKYKFMKATPWKRTPIEENPVEFVRAKGVHMISEVSSTDIVLQYPVNQRILEVWLAVSFGLPHERVLVYGIKEPRMVDNTVSEERAAADLDRMPEKDKAKLSTEPEKASNEELLFGEQYNKKFLDELAKLKKEKGDDYFRNYPTKDEIMGDALRPTYDSIMNTPNMGAGSETSKQVDNASQFNRKL
jgi:hypothetical protein